MSGTRTHRLRLVGSYGSNKIMAGELSRLLRRAYDDVRVVPPVKEGPSSVSFPFDERIAALAVRYHRTSARVLWELFRSGARRLEPLYADLLELMGTEERGVCWDGATISVEAHFVGDFAAGERQIVGCVKNAILDGAARRGVALRVNPERPDLLFDVRLLENEVVVSLDLAGRPMHQRGYRHRAGTAPLREDVAALLVMLARFDARTEALIDPMAGAGTIPIEAACMASGRYNWCSGRAPLGERLPALRHWFERRAEPLFTGTEPLVLMNELDPMLARLAEQNAQTAGVARWIHSRVGDFRDWSPGEVQRSLRERGLAGGLILCNPPYGERLGGAAVAKLYREFGKWYRSLDGFRLAVIVANPDFETLLGERARVTKPLRNGAIKARFCLFDR